MICPNCGKEIADNSKFCGFCGTKIITKLQEEKTANAENVSVEPTSNNVTVEAINDDQKKKKKSWIPVVLVLLIAFVAGVSAFKEKLLPAKVEDSIPMSPNPTEVGVETHFGDIRRNWNISKDYITFSLKNKLSKTFATF